MQALARILEALGNVTYLGEYPALSVVQASLSSLPEGVMLGYDLQDMLSRSTTISETEQALLIIERSAAVRQKMGLTELLPHPSCSWP